MGKRLEEIDKSGKNWKRKIGQQEGKNRSKEKREGYFYIPHLYPRE